MSTEPACLSQDRHVLTVRIVEVSWHVCGECSRELAMSVTYDTGCFSWLSLFSERHGSCKIIVKWVPFISAGCEWPGGAPMLMNTEYSPADRSPFCHWWSLCTTGPRMATSAQSCDCSINLGDDGLLLKERGFCGSLASGEILTYCCV